MQVGAKYDDVLTIDLTKIRRLVVSKMPDGGYMVSQSKTYLDENGEVKSYFLKGASFVCDRNMMRTIANGFLSVIGDIVPGDDNINWD